MLQEENVTAAYLAVNQSRVGLGLGLVFKGIGLASGF